MRLSRQHSSASPSQQLIRVACSSHWTRCPFSCWRGQQTREGQGLGSCHTFEAVLPSGAFTRGLSGRGHDSGHINKKAIVDG